MTDPTNMELVDTVQIDARTVNDVKISEDGRIGVLSREGASNRRNGIVILDVSNPRDVTILSTGNALPGPNVLGRERWASSPVSEKARESLGKLSARGKAARFRRDLIKTVFMAAFTEAALSVAEAEDIAMAKREAQRVMASLYSLLLES